MKIDLHNDDEFDKMLGVLRVEIVDAHVKFQLLKDLRDSYESYEKVFIESRTFWELTLNSLKDSYLSTLCRVYDDNKRGLNLMNLLDTVEANRASFATDKFRERLKDNEFVDSLSQLDREPTTADIKRDRKLVNATEPLVARLKKWRHNIVAHRNAKIAIGRSDILDQHQLTEDDIEKLLSRALKLYNKYSQLFRASTASVQMVGHEDYESLLRFAASGIEAYCEKRGISH